MLTRVDINKVFQKKKLGAKRLQLPIYKFMTDNELEEARADARKKIDNLIQMPPVVVLRKPLDNIYSKDPALTGLDTSKFIFTDITFGVRNSERLIVIRDTDGTLKDAENNVRDRINQLYFPLNGRNIRKPRMFEDNYLENLLNRKEYKFILDRACIQYEPDSEDYQRITSITYQYVDKNNNFNLLRSTRHFGPLTFFLVWFKSIDNLLLDVIETMHIDEAISLVKLYSDIHKLGINGQDLELVENYIKNHSDKRAPLELVFQSYKEAEEERKALHKGVQVAHGLV